MIRFKKNKLYLVFVFTIFLQLACSPYWNNPPLGKARDFLDAYYVTADLKKSLEMTEGLAREMILQEIELLKGVNTTDAYRARDVSFSVNQSSDAGDKLNALFNMTLYVPGTEPKDLQIAIVVNKSTLKIAHFAETK